MNIEDRRLKILKIRGACIVLKFRICQFPVVAIPFPSSFSCWKEQLRPPPYFYFKTQSWLWGVTFKWVWGQGCHSALARVPLEELKELEEELKLSKVKRNSSLGLSLWHFYRRKLPFEFYVVWQSYWERPTRCWLAFVSGIFEIKLESQAKSMTFKVWQKSKYNRRTDGRPCTCCRHRFVSTTARTMRMYVCVWAWTWAGFHHVVWLPRASHAMIPGDAHVLSQGLHWHAIRPTRGPKALADLRGNKTRF